MLIRITPKLFKSKELAHLKCVLHEMDIPAFSIKYRQGEHIDSRTPFPNSQYMVVCRNVNHRPYDGIFIDTDKAVSDFTVICRWSVNGSLGECSRGKGLITHVVHYQVIDTDFDAISDAMLLWMAFLGWESRWPACATGWTPTKAQPCMALTSIPYERVGDIKDTCDERGRLVHREEVFTLPTIERARLFVKLPLTKNMPPYKSVNYVSIAETSPMTK